mgnify:CR=1 FL=1
MIQEKIWDQTVEENFRYFDHTFHSFSSRNFTATRSPFNALFRSIKPLM